MAFSISKLPHRAQHFLECDTEGCERNCQSYCNECHQRLCEQCKEKHQKSPQTKSHEVVPFQHRKRQLPEVKCQRHPSKDIDMLCNQCQVPVCSKCATKDHVGHTLVDLESEYAEKCATCLHEINKVEEYFLPTSKELITSVKDDSEEIKKIMDGIRASMKIEAESLKSMVDTVTSEKIEQANKTEESLLRLLGSQDKKYNDYVAYLHKLTKTFHGYLFPENLHNLIAELSKNLKIEPIPETTKPVLPVFTPGRYSKEDVTKLLGTVTFPETKPKTRKIKPMETVPALLKPTEKPSQGKSDMKQTLSLASSVTKVREYRVPGVDSVCHMSLGKSGRLWASNDIGNLVQTDQQGNLLQKIPSTGGFGYHTVTQNQDLMFTDQKNKVIKRLAMDKTISEVITTGDWEPISIHSSHINGDILVGMTKSKEPSRIVRYNKEGKELQNIQRDNGGQELYRYPYYITENINGDICTPDIAKQAVVVVGKSGQHRFSYTGQGSECFPFGICTDLLGHIIVCDGFVMNNTVDILDQDGQFLRHLLTQQQGVECPRSVCVDDEDNLHVGQQFTNTVTVYKYLQ